jgi:PilZ domain
VCCLDFREELQLSPIAPALETAATPDPLIVPGIQIQGPEITREYGTQRHPRTKCFLAVELRIESDSGLLIGNLSDVSAGGCCVETTRMLDHGTTVSISPLDASGLLWVRGVAVNTRLSEGSANFRIGIQFLEPDPASTQSLQQFLALVAETAAKKNPDESSTYLRWLSGH